MAWTSKGEEVHMALKNYATQLGTQRRIDLITAYDKAMAPFRGSKKTLQESVVIATRIPASKHGWKKCRASMCASICTSFWYRRKERRYIRRYTCGYARGYVRWYICRYVRQYLRRYIRGYVCRYTRQNVRQYVGWYAC